MSRGTQVPAVSLSVSGTGLSPALAELSSSFPLPTHESHMPALQPRLNESSRFGLIPFRSPLLWESRLISFPSGTEMFHFPRSAPQLRYWNCFQWVAPFRDPRVNGCLLLSAAFRSLLRLSSAFSAKAFPSCYVYLNLINPLWTFFPKAFFNSGFPKLFCFIPSLLSWFVRLENEELEGFKQSVLERFAIIFLRLYAAP